MNTQILNTQAVLVVGGGPVGLLMGIQLQRFGIAHRLIEKRLERQPFSKAFAIHSRSLEVFEDIGVLVQVLERAARVKVMNIYSNKKRLINYNFGLLDVPYAFAASIPQNIVEEILEAHYVKLGGRIERGVELISLTQDEKSAKVVLAEQNGRHNPLEFSWVVGCDGGQSHVREQLGVPFEGSVYDRPYIIADGTLTWNGDHSSGHVFTAGDGYMMLFPLPQGRHRVVIDCKDHALQTADLTSELVNQRLRERGFEDVVFSNPVWLSITTFQHRMAKHYRIGRAFLAGDACHVHSPIGGQGLNTGLQDAYNLSWKIAHVVNLGGSDALLESYQEERRPVAETVLIKTSQQMRMLNMKNPLLRVLRNALVPRIAMSRGFQLKVMGQAAGFQVSYRPSRLTARNDSTKTLAPTAGLRMLDGALSDRQGENRRVFELMKGTHYSLLLFDGAGSSAETLLLRQSSQLHKLHGHKKDFLQTYRIVTTPDQPATNTVGVELFHDNGAALHRMLDANNGGLFLVRPDGYIALKAGLEELHLVTAYLEALYGVEEQPWGTPTPVLTQPA